MEIDMLLWGNVPPPIPERPGSLMWQEIKYNELYVIIYKDRYELINGDKKLISEGKVIFESLANGYIKYSLEPIIVLENCDTVTGSEFCFHGD
jgi:hypothetical protein